jgi:hypothetical protein
MKLRRRMNPLPRAWTFAALGALTVAVLVLSVLALAQHRSSPVTADTPRPTGTADPTPEGSPSPSPTPSDTPEPEAPASVVPTRHLTQLSSGTLIRATTGQCNGPAPAIEFSTDSGATWSPGDAGGATQILRLLAGDIGQAIAFDDSCQPTGIWSFNDGATWEQTTDFVAGSWFFNPAADTTVRAPDGDRPLPCRTLAFSAWDITAIALCDDGTVVTTSDAASTWSEPVDVDGALTVSAAPDGFRVLIDGSAADCDGVQVTSLADGAPQPAGACLTTEFEPGDVALAAAGDGSVVAWAGDEFARSGDGGATWG